MVRQDIGKSILDNRKEQIQKTANWLGATPMTPHGTNLVIDNEPDYSEISDVAQNVKHLLSAGIDIVSVTEQRPGTKAALQEAIRAVVSEEQFARVQFLDFTNQVVDSGPAVNPITESAEYHDTNYATPGL